MIERNDELKRPLDTISLLTDDHQKVKNLFARYESARNFTERHAAAERLFTELEIHTELEETIFYPAYAARVSTEGAQRVAESRVIHARLKELMRALQELNIEDEAFEITFNALMEDVQEHVQEEEQGMFPAAKEILADQLEDLMDEMLTRKAQVTTP